ncbi:ABC transporter ATP-binding protein [Facklamia miroungae]|uniref:Iron(III) transport system ATP-binding protein n=1 Tax=Facklamia miroungae TaxID=120956 RepID=A0A1G7V4U9_9LACT|nr:ABC transporter ATP-binding protein [Facklamia miroungae]NKZ30225.1 ABC transporter ATP-binding protein [Facklamia miroungae]SDG54399.1 iron(III) transport system ATP-binding protein [Facklamia miroungae]
MTTRITRLNKKFGDFQALFDINLEIKNGEFVAILGPSGCGKTTLLRILAGFEIPTSGQVYIDGKCVSDVKRVLPPENRNVSMVFQSFALWPHVNVKDHIKFPLLHDQFVDETIRKAPEQRVEEVLDSIGLAALAERLPGHLSGGQKQRVALGRAIAPEPNLLLMDEPLSSLDAELRMEMRREIQKLHQITKASIVYVTHDQGEALAMADRIIVMKDGRIEQSGTPQEIYYQPETEFVANFVSKANILNGKWHNEGFQLAGTNVIWPDNGIAKKIKEQEKYYLRPEDIYLSLPIKNTLQGLVQTCQFQGSEYHYSLEINNGQVLIAHVPFTEKFEINQRLSILPREVY